MTWIPHHTREMSYREMKQTRRPCRIARRKTCQTYMCVECPFSVLIRAERLAKGVEEETAKRLWEGQGGLEFRKSGTALSETKKETVNY